MDRRGKLAMVKHTNALAKRIRQVARLEDIPNVGGSIAGDLRQLGITSPGDLPGRDPYELYDDLCRVTGQRHDPCVLDTFIAAVRYMEGGPKAPWWKFTSERKRTLAARKRLDGPHGESANHPFIAPRAKLLGVAGTFAVCKLPTGSPLPPWATAGDLFSVTRTPDELSVVCRQETVPEGIVSERGWRCLRVAGSMPFTLVGVLASLTTPLAKAGVGVFVFSTFDTDYLLVKEGEFSKAVAALRTAGHEFEPLPESKEDQ
jgi:hypothetical protein